MIRRIWRVISLAGARLPTSRTTIKLTESAERLRAHFEHARVKDPDLESLRSRSDFLALFD